MNDFVEHGQVVLGLTIICLNLSRVRTQHEFALGPNINFGSEVCAIYDEGTQNANELHQELI